jgi:3D (Asp-Asp-Asp) domain-containing protein
MKRFIMALVALCGLMSQVAGVSQYTDRPIDRLNPEKKVARYTVVQKTEFQLVYVGRFTITAYCAGCGVCDTTYKTADGTYADYRKRIVAADPRVPFGTTMMIDGFEDQYTVRDRGGKIKGRCIDVLMSSHWRARKFGRQEKDVWMWQPIETEIEVEVPHGATLTGN